MSRPTGEDKGPELSVTVPPLSTSGARADEPTRNLDSRSGAEVFKLMREMNGETGVAFVMVTHDDRLARQADRILLIEDGSLYELTGRTPG